MYHNTRFDVYTKVVLSPGFPHEYPIISIMNIDARKFKVHDNYSGHACPDGTFEIVLQSNSNWAYSKQFGPVLAELHQKLAKDFPFYKNHSGQAQHYAKPDVYENRAGLLPGHGPGGNQRGNMANSQPGGQFNQPDQRNWSNNQNQPPAHISKPPAQNLNYLDPKLERSSKEELGILADTLQIDVNGLSEALRTVLTKNEEIKMRESTLKSHIVLILTLKPILVIFGPDNRHGFPRQQCLKQILRSEQ
jgi:hypothetical protein